ncbi:hypothetical protein [Thiosocius teredinicola]
MRIVYLTLGFFILLGIGAACRTPPPLGEDCESVGGGLVRCERPVGERRE